jgi:hypothetical protein
MGFDWARPQEAIGMEIEGANAVTRASFGGG